MELFNCVLWKAQKDGGIPKPEKYYGVSRTEMNRLFDVAQTDDTTVMFEAWHCEEEYNPNTNFVWEPQNPYWKPQF